MVVTELAIAAGPDKNGTPYVLDDAGATHTALWIRCIARRNDGGLGECCIRQRDVRRSVEQIHTIAHFGV